MCEHDPLWELREAAARYQSGPVNIVFVADFNGYGDPAEAEVRQALQRAFEGGQGKNPSPLVINSVGSAGVNTVDAGIKVGIFGLASPTKRPALSLVFHNVDPRANLVGQKKGASFYVALLKSGLLVFGPNSGWNLAFVREQIRSVYRVVTGEEYHQFRSRDFYPFIIAQTLRGELDQIEGPLERQEWNIPDVPDTAVGTTDNYGNIKLTLSAAAPLFNGRSFGEQLRVRVRGRSDILLTATYSPTLFNGEGGLFLYPGSTVFEGHGRTAFRHMELGIHGGDASAALGAPSGGTKVLLEWATKGVIAQPAEVSSVGIHGEQVVS